MKFILMFRLIIGLSVLMLASCADMNEVNSSFSLNGHIYKGLNLQDPHFYMDDDRERAPILSDPRCC